MLHAKISPPAYYLPKQVVTNADLTKFVDISPDYILDKLGIEQRHFIGSDETASTMAVEAVSKLFNAAPELREQIEFIIITTQNPDNILPGIAPKIQNELNLSKNIFALDINLACSAYPYALSIAASLINSGLLTKGLIITSECYSRRMNIKDKNVCTLFGDAATATLIESTSEDSGFISFDFGTDGSGYDFLMIPAGGIKYPISQESSLEKEFGPSQIRSDNNVYMNGKEIFNFVMDMVPKSIGNCLKKGNLSLASIDYFVFHQANNYMLKALSRNMKLPDEKVILDIKDYGNTVSSTIPIALSNMYKNNLLRKGDIVLMCGFGVGLSWSTCIYKV
jgi:3-oxoacyl-[acyl-carrier-protein] synthase-3